KRINEVVLTEATKTSNRLGETDNSISPKAKQSSEGASLKTTPSVGKKNVSTPGNVFSLSNSFEALNVENPVIEEVETGNKASTSSVQEEGQRFTPLVEMINVF
ncbi:hypothetical protein Tco_0504187, partial [Tanacetum coccineum]